MRILFVIVVILVVVVFFFFVGVVFVVLFFGLLFLLNYFFYVDFFFGIQILNVDFIDLINFFDFVIIGFLGRYVEFCFGQDQWGIKLVFVFVDFFNCGFVIEMGDRFNGI